MHKDVKLVEGFVKSVKHEFGYYSDTNGKKVPRILSDNMIDIVATDKNITSHEEDGIKLISKIRRQSPYVDILFYSGQGITENDRKALEKYAFVEIINTKDIFKHLRMMIKKNLSKWDDISFLRGIVITLIVDLENQMNSFILKQYKIDKKNSQSFKTNVLQNRYFSFEGKKWALSKLIDPTKYPGLLKKLETLQKARNALAHSVPHESKKNCLLIEGKGTTIDKNYVTKIYNKGRETAKQLEELIENTK